MTLSQMAQTLDRPSIDAADAGVAGVSIDSRTLREGELFVAIKGDRFDGHDFVADALRRGAVAAVVESRFKGEHAERPVIRVPDTVEALQRMAGWYRSRFELPVVAVTGTNGKTTTKDMAAAVLSSALCTMKTEGNLNNHIGVPLTLFGLSSRHEAAVVEMGMNHPGEIGRLAGIAAPAVGVITNVAEAHMEGMGSLDAIADAKGELLEALPADGTAILNADDERVMSQAARTSARVVTFGLSDGADVRATAVHDGRSVGFETDDGAVELPVPGRHNVMNALAALAVGRVLGVEAAAAMEGLSSFTPSPMRMSVIDAGRWTVLNDAYNANPGSLGAALDALVALAADGRTMVAAIGDMLELGSRTRAAHREAGALAAEKGVDHLLLFGKEVEALREGALAGGMRPERVRLFDDKAALVDALRRIPDDVVLLVKGSRAMRMEEVVELLTRGAPAS